tara:strand:- start:36 stop:665 length:630 start_codon:yes stop_codon:yes gene_type:complete
MLSLSLFCSSQTTSIAIFEKQQLKQIFKKTILDNGTEGIFEILEECSLNFDLKKLSYIYLCNGPGSFTALRSLKAIAQALSISSGAKIIFVTSFAAFFPMISKEEKVLVCFEGTKNTLFFQFFEKKKSMLFPSEELKFGKEEHFKKYYKEKKKVNQDLTLITSYRFEKIKIKEPEVYYKEIDASMLAKAVFLGYGLKDDKIFYHKTYYE